MSNKIVSFPWSPGIPWQLDYKSCVSPKLPFDLFETVLEKKELVVGVYGGLFESFYSLCLFEVLNKNLRNTLKWCGYPEYYGLLEAQGLAVPFLEKVTPYDMKRFPTPIFFDKNERAYFNCLNNYLIKTPYHSTFFSKGFKNPKPVIQQIVEKVTIPWDRSCLPKFRFEETFGDFTDLFKMRNISLKKKTILLMPDSTELSIHKESNIDWNKHQVKSFIVMATQANYQVILLTNNSEAYWGTLAKVIPFSINMFFSLIEHVKFLIAKEVDYSLIALSYDVNIISNERKWFMKNEDDPRLNLERNVKFLKSSSVIYTEGEVLPETAIKFM